MSLSHAQMKTRLNSIRDSEVLDRVGYTVQSQERSLDLKNIFSGEKTPYLLGREKISDSSIFDGNIERFFGIAQIPVGLIGPLKVNGPFSRGTYQVPLATTEGSLVASYNRGAKVMTMSGGANVLCFSECMTRSPGFVFSNVLDSTQFVAWTSENFKMIREVAQKTTRYGKLEDFDAIIDGKYVWLNFKYVSGDAAGQNMVTVATDAVCEYIIQHAPVVPKKWYIDANISGDKKPTRRSQQTGRGKSMLAEVTIDKDICKRVLHVAPEEIVDYSQMAMLAGIHSGSIGVNGHFTNGLAALFIACGQDVACVAESSTGTSKAELTEQGDLYASITLPNLVIGTVGGGTHLPTQKECLQIMGCYGKDKSKKFAEICAAVILAGEISIAAAIAGGYFTQAHVKYGRRCIRDKKSKKKLTVD